MILPVSLAQGVLGGASGSLVGLSLGMVGGGGSILAVPLLVYVVGVANPHVAIGTSAVAVAANAAVAVLGHARSRNVRWPCAAAFAAAGVLGALAGSALGRRVDGQALLAAFAVLMFVVALLMLRRGSAGEDASVRLNRQNAPAVLGIGAGVGALSGFFGIGGGFLIVPGLVFATGMPMLSAIGTSLVAVTAFGITTAGTYAAAGLVNWPLAALFIAGGAIGTMAGGRLAQVLSRRRGTLVRVFAGLIMVVAVYVLVRGLSVV